MEYRTEAERQRELDLYYMGLAESVRARANCFGSEVGAVLVRGNRVISTGYNGTPANFQNCKDGGCLRCQERFELEKDPSYETQHPETMMGKALDICFCVHAEQNALLNAARHGIAVDSSVLYATHQPCFSCLKESVQAGTQRIVYLVEWFGAKDKALKEQYLKLADQLTPTQGSGGFQQIDSDAYRSYRTSHGTLLDELTDAADQAPEMGAGA